jgi:hypothetical protein
MTIALSGPSLDELRPLPGSRVSLIPATTQGAGVPFIGAPVKGQTAQEHRVQYPPSVFNCNQFRDLGRRVTKL